MEETIQKIFQESLEVKQQTLKNNAAIIKQAAEEIIGALKNHRKLFFFGNGGSAADSQHIAAEFVGRFQKERQPWPAIALTTDSSILTALGNDYGFDIVFARQIKALGNSGDIAIGISTSGNSPNVIEGLRQAKALGMKTIGLTGGDGGKMAGLSDLTIIVPSRRTARIQETHILIAHTLCQLAEDALTVA